MVTVVTGVTVVTAVVTVFKGKTGDNICYITDNTEQTTESMVILID